jgi:hypothetical protein
MEKTKRRRKQPQMSENERSERLSQVKQSTRIFRYDLDRIGTSIRGLGWLEYVFVFIVTAIILTFGILSYFGIL